MKMMTLFDGFANVPRATGEVRKTVLGMEIFINETTGRFERVRAHAPLISAPST